MKLAVLADDDGAIIAVAECRMSMTGEVGTFTEDAVITAEMRRPGAEEDADLITSVMIDVPEDLLGVSVAEIHETMMLDRSADTPRLTRKAAAS